MIPGTGEIHSSGRGHIGDEYVQYRRGHSRDKGTRNKGTTTPSTSVQVQRLKQSTKTTSTQQRQRTRERWVPERTTRRAVGAGSEPPFDSTRAMLNDLARGQQEMRNSIAQMALNSQIIQNNLSTIGASIVGGAVGHTGHQGGGASGSSGNVAGTSGQMTPTHTYTSAGRIPRPLFPQFQTGQQVGQPGQGQGGTTKTRAARIGAARTGADRANRSLCRVQMRLLGTRSRVSRRHESDGLLFDPVSKQAQGGAEGQHAATKHRFYQESWEIDNPLFRRFG
jgi:hypothetical protein